MLCFVQTCLTTGLILHTCISIASAQWHMIAPATIKESNKSFDTTESNQIKTVWISYGIFISDNIKLSMMHGVVSSGTTLNWGLRGRTDIIHKQTPGYDIICTIPLLYGVCIWFHDYTMVQFTRRWYGDCYIKFTPFSRRYDSFEGQVPITKQGWGAMLNDVYMSFVLNTFKVGFIFNDFNRAIRWHFLWLTSAVQVLTSYNLSSWHSSNFALYAVSCQVIDFQFRTSMFYFFYLDIYIYLCQNT